MNFEKFKEQFHESWWEKIQPFIESEECDNIYAYLKKESKRGVKIAPLSSLTYRAFLETPLTELKVIIVGMCPYHTFINGVSVADGLALSCSVTGKLQPSLIKFYDGIEKDLYRGMNLNYKKSPDLTYLAEQGVLLLNAALTTEKDKPGKHLALWEPFIKYLFTDVIGHTYVPFIFLGKEAAKTSKYLGVFTHSFKLDHPAFAARNHDDWDVKGTFKKVNVIVKENTGKEIDWVPDKVPF